MLLLAVVFVLAALLTATYSRLVKFSDELCFDPRDFGAIEVSTTSPPTARNCFSLMLHVIMMCLT
jgi:hypothetical protein